MRHTRRPLPLILLVVAAISTEFACDRTRYNCPDVDLRLPAGHCQVIPNVCRSDGKWRRGDRIVIVPPTDAAFQFETARTPIDDEFAEQRICAGDANPFTTQSVDVSVWHWNTEFAGRGTSLYHIETRPELRVTLTATPPTVPAGGAAILRVDVSGGVPPYTYAWSPPGTASETQTFVFVAPLATTTYAVLVSDSTGQQEQASTSVAVVPGRCGDGFVNQLSEACDDGNTTDGDGCSSTCQRENQNPGTP